MEEDIKKLDESFDLIIHQLTKGNTIDGLKNNRLYLELEKVKEWESKYGYQFHIYSNDHPIDKKPHFHLIKKADDLECRIFFDGEIHDFKGRGRLDKNAKDALKYFLENPRNQEILKLNWNHKNPNWLCK
jgi:hypothetical protein